MCLCVFVVLMFGAVCMVGRCVLLCCVVLFRVVYSRVLCVCSNVCLCVCACVSVFGRLFVCLDGRVIDWLIV